MEFDATNEQEAAIMRNLQATGLAIDVGSLSPGIRGMKHVNLYILLMLLLIYALILRNRSVNSERYSAIFAPN